MDAFLQLMEKTMVSALSPLVHTFSLIQKHSYQNQAILLFVSIQMVGILKKN